MNLSSPAEAPQEGSAGAKAHDDPTAVGSDLLRALAGMDANRERVVAHRTRRVVMSSGGVLKEQKRNRSRARAVAVAFAVVLLLLMAPLMWEVTDSLIGGDKLGDPGNQLSLWACIVCPTLLGAALVVGWLRHRS